MGFENTELSDLLKAEPLAEIVAAGQPVFATSGPGKQAVWANAAALALLGASNIEDLTGQLDRSTDPAIRQLSRLGMRVRPGGAAQLQKIRFRNAGSAGVMITIRCWSVALPADDGGDNKGVVFWAAALDAPSHLCRPAELSVVSAVPASEDKNIADKQVDLQNDLQNDLQDGLETEVHASMALKPSIPPSHAVSSAPRRANVRFMWRSDGQGKLLSIDSALCETLGCDNTALVGRSFDDLIDNLPLEPGGPLRAALARRDTWSRVEVLWPFADARRSAPVTLGGLPSADRRGVFDGYSGFGVIHLDAVVDRPVRTVAKDSKFSQSNKQKSDASGPGPNGAAAGPGDNGDGQASEKKPVVREADNVVSLRAWQSDNKPARETTLDESQATDSRSPAVKEPEPPADSTKKDADKPAEEARQPDANSTTGNTAVTDKPISGKEPSPLQDAENGSSNEKSAESTTADLAQETEQSSAGLSLHVPKAGPDGSIELSDNERNAFREIARALGARVRDETLDKNSPPQDRNAVQPSGNAEPDDALDAGKVSVSKLTGDTSPAEDAHNGSVAEDSKGKPKDTLSKFARAINLAKQAAENNKSDATQAQDSENASCADHAEREAQAATGSPAASQPDDDNSKPEKLTASAGTVPAPAMTGNTEYSEIAGLLDRIGSGLLTIQDGEAVFVNQPLLGSLGYKTSDAFKAAGGLEHMFRGRDPETLAREAAGGAIPVITATGDILAMDGKMHAASWRGKPATLLTLQPSQMLEREAKLRSLELDLRKREGELRELHSILDTATDGVALLDKDGRILSLNGSGQALFGYDQNEVVGENFTVLLARESHTAAKEYFAGLQGEGVKNILNDGREVQGRASKGGMIPLFITIGQITSAPEQRFCAVLRDVTQWKKAERELSESRQEAERTSSLKSEFLAKISHEVRTPLNAILGFAEVIIDERFGPVENERYKDYLKDIHASGTHVLSLINDLLDLSKIEAGKLELEFGSVDAGKIVNECVSIMQSQALRERVIMRLSLAPRLPNIVADERSLRQIILNILSNAVKFNEPGGQIIVSTALTDAGAAVIRIRDTGIGMSDQDVQMALEPFRQVATSRKAGGTGLGLPLTKALVEANRASFTIKSKKDEGTLVEVAFPQTRVLAE